MYLDYIKTLPINDNPEIFGLHDNANITFAQNETFSLLNGLLTMQPKTGGGKGRSREEVRLVALALCESIYPLLMKTHELKHANQGVFIAIEFLAPSNSCLIK